MHRGASVTCHNIRMWVVHFTQFLNVISHLRDPAEHVNPMIQQIQDVGRQVRSHVVLCEYTTGSPRTLCFLWCCNNRLLLGFMCWLSPWLMLTLSCFVRFLNRCRLFQWFTTHSFYAHRLSDSFNVCICTMCLKSFESWQSMFERLPPPKKQPSTYIQNIRFYGKFVATSFSLVAWWCLAFDDVSYHVCSGKADVRLACDKGLFARCCPRWLHCCTSVSPQETVWEEDGHKLCLRVQS